MVGQCPQVDTIGRRTPGNHLGRQQTVGDDGMTVEIEIGRCHGQAFESKRRVYHEGGTARLSLCGAAY
ncbi:hypothetical protein SDC9_205864 [bioreactor metagenome]|uniref:Uncharacterized protein n=1 Tax=bioreactor metagenome TaxID=1076179 RepID=A0A645JEY2_9ZZZZ